MWQGRLTLQQGRGGLATSYTRSFAIATQFIPTRNAGGCRSSAAGWGRQPLRTAMEGSGCGRR